MTDERLLHGNLLVEPLQGVPPLHLLKLRRCVLVQELIDGQVASTHSDIDPLFINLDEYSPGSELVNPLTLAHEHNLELLSIRVVINILGKSAIDLVITHRYVHRNPRFQIHDVLLECLHLDFTFLQQLQQLQRLLLRIKQLVL